MDLQSILDEIEPLERDGGAEASDLDYWSQRDVFPPSVGVRPSHARPDLPGFEDEPHEAYSERSREVAVDEDGVPYYVAGGEVISPEAYAKLESAPELDRPAFSWTIESRPEAETALGKRAKLEREILGLKAEKLAITKNIDSQIRDVESRLKWWDFRFAINLIEFARSILGKTKTVKFSRGQVAFRNKAATIEITDNDAAVEWARKWAPEIIKKREYVNKTDLAPTLARLAEEGVDTTLVFVKEIPAVENAPSISTGIE